MAEKLKFSRKGYERFLEEIKGAENALAELRIYKGKDAINQGDNWHDNPTLYQAESAEASLMYKLRTMKDKLLDIVIVEKLDDETRMDIDNFVRVDMIYSAGNIEESIIELTGGMPDVTAAIPRISINSPLGMAVYGKKIGELGNFEVEGRKFGVRIKEKMNLSNEIEQNQPTKTLTK